MKFTEAYQQYIKREWKGDVLRCAETKEDLFFEYNVLAMTRRGEYWGLYLDTCGEIEHTVKPLISWNVYDKLYAKQFEQQIRKGKIADSAFNRNLCIKFNIPERYEGKTFDNIDKIAEQERQVNAAKNWCADGYREALILGGNKGIGKTTIGVCVMMDYYVKNDLDEKQLPTSISMIKETRLLSASMKQVSIPDMMERLCNLDFLLYDDMFSIGDKEYARRFLFELIDTRVECKGLPTVITTSLPHDIMKRDYADIYSRLSRGKVDYSNQKLDLRGVK